MNFEKKGAIILDLASGMVYNGIAYSVKRLVQRISFSRVAFGKAHASRC